MLSDQTKHCRRFQICSIYICPVLADFYIIELCKYSTRATTMQWSLNYGVSSYVCAKQNKTDGNGELTPIAELARATYNYGLSATAYNEFAKQKVSSNANLALLDTYVVFCYQGRTHVSE